MRGGPYLAWNYCWNWKWTVSWLSGTDQSEGSGTRQSMIRHKILLTWLATVVILCLFETQYCISLSISFIPSIGAANIWRPTTGLELKSRWAYKDAENKKRPDARLWGSASALLIFSRLFNKSAGKTIKRPRRRKGCSRNNHKHKKQRCRKNHA